MDYTFDPRFLNIAKIHQQHELRITAEQEKRLYSLIRFIWPEQDQQRIIAAMNALLLAAQKRLPARRNHEPTGWSEKQEVLICYGDHIRSNDPKISPLQALNIFCRDQFHEDVFSALTVHLLPIYTSPYKDGGFDITDPFAVNPDMGTWDDVRNLTQHFNVAVDFVANHLSVSSEWFKHYMQDDPLFQDFFIGVDDEEIVRDLEHNALPKIYRPRPHNPFIPVKKPDGSTRWVYMTFSDHQADVNYRNPFVFLKMTETLLFYLLHGVKMIRLDAIPYLWKEWGTPCVHHPKTHGIVELTRLTCDVVNPSVKLLAESMEPLADSQRYLSSGETQKAHLAYNFVPCGLIPHTLLTEDASIFQQKLHHFLPPGEEVNWAVVCGVTHDGSSINPCRTPQSIEGEAILDEDQINSVAAYYTDHGCQELAARCELPGDHPHAVPKNFEQTFIAKHGQKPRFVNYKTITDEQGQPQQIVYEAITTYASLFDQQPEKILAALGMALALPGIPFVYLTLPFAKLNDFAYYLETGNPRELNRGRVELEELLQDLRDETTLTFQVFTTYKEFLKVRASCSAFHPNGTLIPVRSESKSLISFLRLSPDNTQRILITQNVSSAPQTIDLSLPERCAGLTTAHDLMLEESLQLQNRVLSLEFQPFAIRWFDLKA
ncbi:hypothetical protein CSA56_17950 [candidate division KSB3 bacterium]|uniref:Glycosyl hydrolase family 13 catalytic domain-containing protein n=1 Tax=candidate division KSB3 bacterium TaxID=2044937 RepID=A0A2G6K763_9BACT|nr:MAG: hypothetical protein CSA56_17950 [candidate division KSB3 bacterium]